MEVEGVDKLIRHAKKFGTSGVMDYAVELHQIGRLQKGDLITLLIACDSVDAQQATSRQFGTAKKHRLTVEERVDRLLGLASETPETEEAQ